MDRGARAGLVAPRAHLLGADGRGGLPEGRLDQGGGGRSGRQAKVGGWVVRRMV